MQPANYSLRTRLLLFTTALAGPLSAAPIANPDSYTTFEDTFFSVAAPGLLGNDNANGATGTLTTVKVTDPAHGAITLNGDGSFSYLPTANYNGPDSFQYKIVEAAAPIEFTVDQPNSVMNVTVTSTTYITGGTTDTKNTTAQVAGDVSAVVTPTSSPFSTVHVQSLYVALAQPVDLTLCLQRIIFCTASLRARIDPNAATDPRGLTITMDPAQAGPPATVAANGTFSQTGNHLNAVGRVDLTPSGLAGLIEVPDHVDLNNTDMAFDFNNASISRSGNTLTLALPLDITQVYSDNAAAPTYTVSFHLTGTIHATAPVPTVVESSPATVTLTVNPTDDPPTASADRYYTRQNNTINIPAAATQSTEDLILAGATWRYNTGTNLGTAWKEWGYIDTVSGWLSGAGEFGYGDGDEVTVVDDGPTAGLGTTPNDQKYPTIYFRREFTLTNPYDTIQPTFELKRDDAAVVFINGSPIYTDTNFPTGSIDYSTRANASVTDETAFTAASAFSRSTLLEGKNVVAVEVHQTSSTSDASFNFRLKRTRGVAGLLANDSDLENDPFTAQLTSGPGNGSVAINPDGSFTYTPAQGFSGTDTFVYQLFQGGFPAASVLQPFNTGATWKVLEPTANLDAAAWKTLAYDDSTWASLAAPLGYAYADIPAASTLTYGADPANKPITHYFRKKITLSVPPSLINSAVVELRRDDGAAIWLNGTEVGRSNMPGTLGDGTLTNTTPAQSRGNALPTDLIEIAIDHTKLVAGENILAVELHQGSADSSDLVFDMRLTLGVLAGAEVTVVVLDDDADNDHVSDTWERANNYNPASAADASIDSDGDGQTTRTEFLAGTEPRDARKHFKIDTVALNAGNISLTFPATQARQYQVQCSANLASWTNQGAPVTANITGNLTLQVPVSGACRYYRVKVLYDWQ